MEQASQFLASMLKLNRRGDTADLSWGMDVSVVVSCNSVRNDQLQTCGKHAVSYYLRHVLSTTKLFTFDAVGGR